MSFTFEPIDLDTYPRRAHFEAFREMKLSYSVTVTIDVTELRSELRKRGLRAYAAQIWMLSDVVNRIPEFRMSVDPEGRLGLFNRLEPLYTVFNDELKTFSSVWTAFHPDFATFHDAVVSDIARFNTGEYVPQPDVPINMLNVSSIPWLDFTAFNMNMPTDYTLPIFTIGRYVEEGVRTMMPLAIQVHHAVCDGYHLGLFIEQLRALAADCTAWLPVVDTERP